MLNQMIPIRTLLDNIHRTLKGITMTEAHDDATNAAHVIHVLLTTMGDAIPKEVIEELYTICGELDICPESWDM